MHVAETMGQELARHERRAAGMADGAGNVEVLESCAFRGKLVDIWRFDIRVAVAPQVAPTQIVGEQKQEIRPRRVLRSRGIGNRDQKSREQ